MPLFSAALSCLAMLLSGTSACCILVIRRQSPKACSHLAQGNCNMSNATPEAGASDDAASQESAREMSQQDAPGAGAEVAQADAHAPGGPEAGPRDMPAHKADETTSSSSAPMVSHCLVPNC